MHNKSVEEVLQSLKTDMNIGLSLIQAEERLKIHGENKLQSKKNKPFILKLLSNFKDTMIIILSIACIISFALNIIAHTSLAEPIIILIIIVANVFLGAYQEQKAEKSLDTLSKLTTKVAKVLRNGKFQEIDAKKLVVGDIVKLDEGDLVPCDLRIIYSNDINVDESTLTGESLPCLKFSDTLPKETALAERSNMLYCGCTVVSGNALAVVTATGMQTELGKIAKVLNHNRKAITPLQHKISKLSIIITIVSVLLSCIVLVLGIVDKIAFKDIFMNSISLAIATIPESLTAIITFILALGVSRMANSKAIIKNLPAIETLGSASVICTDKTGTLTQNKMQARIVCDIESNEYDLESKKAKEILAYASLCCNGTEHIGDPSERAILATKNIKYVKKYQKIFELPFDSKRKMMTTVHKINDDEYIVVTKGAFESLYEICKNVDNLNLIKKNEQLADRGTRVLAVGIKKLKTLPSKNTKIESDLDFLGLIGLYDPPREEVKEAIRICKQANIIPIMITGDNPNTARNIGIELGIYDEQTSMVVTSRQLANMSHKELKENLKKIKIYARATPEDKLRIIKAWQELDYVVAMTGDGVNDAPALKHADIGCVMGITGSEVAKKNGDLILTDDNFTTIVSAVQEGRSIYKNIKKVISFLLGTNYCEAIVTIVGLLLFGICPLISIQLLWINLVTDSFPALGLGLCKNDKDIMKEKPIPKKQSIISKKDLIIMLCFGIVMSALSIFGYYLGSEVAHSPMVGSTIAFAIIGYSQLAHSLNLLSDTSIFRQSIKQNKRFYLFTFISITLLSVVLFVPPIANLFNFCILEPIYYIYIFGCSLLPILLMEIAKIILNKVNNKNIKN